MKLFKQIICKIWDIFNLPRFSNSPEIKIPKYKITETTPTDEYKRSIKKYFKNMNFNDIKIYINDKQINKEGE